jgi:PIN domain nuclease of toxin-antitoxin system
MQADSEEFSSTLKATLISEDAVLFLSIASLWEITIKRQSGKLKLEYDLDDIACYCLDNNITIVPISLFHLNQYSSLPPIHKDPFDRMIVATAIANNMSLISRDKKLAAYNINVIW